MSKRKISFIPFMLLLLLVLAIALTACSSSQSDSAAAGEDKAAANAAPAAAAEQAKTSLGDTSAQAAPASEAEPSSAPSSAGGSGAGSTAARGIGPIAGADTGTNRKVIYKANVTMEVPDFDPAEKKLRDAIHLSGSYILQFANTVNTNEKGATYVIKVPADGFSSFIDQLREIEKDMQMQMEGSDVTEEYVDLEARLQAKKTVESRLLAFMDKSTKTDDLVRFSNELAGVQEQIEQIKGRMRFLDQNVAYSTVNVRLYEGTAAASVAAKGEPAFGQRMANALTGSAKVLGQFGQAILLFFAALLPVAAVLALIAVPAFFLIQRQRKFRREASAARRKEWNASQMNDETGPEAKAGKTEPPEPLS